MKKEYKKFLAGIILLVILVFVYFLVGKLDKTEETPKVKEKDLYKEVVLWETGPENIKDVYISNGKNELEFVRDGEKLEMKGYEGLPQNEFALDSLYSISTFKPLDLEVSDELANYGLDKPKFELKISFLDGTEKVLEGGDKTTDGTYLYVKEKEKPNVYAADAGEFLVYEQGINYFFSKNVAPFSSEPADIELLEILYENGDEKFTVSRNDDFGNEYSLSQGYAFAEPFVYGVDYFKTSDMLEQSKVLHGQIHKLNPNKEELTECGFDDVKHKMTVNYNPRGEEDVKDSYTILIGEKKIEKNYTAYYVMREGANIIYLVDEKAILWQDYSELSLSSKQLFISRLKDLDTITLSSASSGKEATYKIEIGEKDNITVKNEGTGEEIKLEDFKHLMKLISQVNATEVLQKSDFQDRPPELLITAKKSDGSTEEVELYQYRGYEAVANIKNHPFADNYYFIFPYNDVIDILQYLDELP